VGLERLLAWIDVEGGKIRDYGYGGGVLMGLTPVTVGPLRVMLPAKANPVIRQVPHVTGGCCDVCANRRGAAGVFVPEALPPPAVRGHPAVHGCRWELIR
jgi:hypothetical protein